MTELANELDLTVQDIASAEMATACTESIQKESGDDGFTLEDVLTDGSQEESLIEQIPCGKRWQNYRSVKKRL